MVEDDHTEGRQAAAAAVVKPRSNQIRPFTHDQKQGEAMRTRKHWGLQLFVSCLLAGVSATAIAQTPYPPNGPTIPPVGVDGRGIAPTHACARSRGQGSRISVEHGSRRPQRPAGTIGLPADHHQPGRPTDRLRRPPQQPEAAHEPAERQSGSEWDVDRRRDRPGEDQIPRAHSDRRGPG